MVKRFKQYNPYTLCLIVFDDGDVFTWCVNVTYRNRKGKVLEFCGDGWIYTVDIETKIVTRTDVDGFIDESLINVTNIVKGWQW